MVTLASQVIDRVLRKFQQQDTPDILASAMDASQTTVTYTGFLPAWGPGTIAAIESERILVTENDEANNVATVIRGWDGTTAATHPSGSHIFLSPRGDRSEVLNLINDCLSDMFPELYKVDAAEKDYNTSKIGYEIPAAAYKILQVSARTNSSSSLWEPVYDWHVEDNAADEFTTGRAIMLRAALPSGGKFRIKYGTTFTKLTAESEDLEADAGLHDFMTDLPYYFALSRLLPAEEQLRSQIRTAQNHQRAQDVPGFLALRTGEWYQARYLDRKLAARKTLSEVIRQTMGTGYGV